MAVTVHAAAGRWQHRASRATAPLAARGLTSAGGTLIQLSLALRASSAGLNMRSSSSSAASSSPMYHCMPPARCYTTEAPLLAAAAAAAAAEAGRARGRLPAQRGGAKSAADLPAKHSAARPAALPGTSRSSLVDFISN
ncbi:uncharacterized protein LOC126273463 [Schistocerca gregaria]|uniref:uncharacterized protein LOC126273463 n=1 Tax=Schistocerca gregaria TaxID=7010 RepID=UPI00211E8FAD|nr:uncharacterized protein LOC126273463 [Schistocerca gregaria]